MRLPKYDILIPTLFVGLIFPAAAGGWWRFFSGHADQIANPAMHSQMAGPSLIEEVSEPRHLVHAAHHPVGHRSGMATEGQQMQASPDPTPAAGELLSDGTFVSGGSYDN